MAGRRKNKDYYTTGEAANFLDLPRRTVTYYCRQGRIKASQHPATKQWKITHEDLVSFMNETNISPQADFSGLRILIVDDEEMILKAATQILENSDLNVTVDTAQDGYKALIKIGRSLPDMLILDIRMPNMDGKTLLKTLKQDEKTKSIRVLASTGFPEDAEAMLKLKADQVLIKPYKSTQLLDAVSNVLQTIIRR